MRSSHSAALYPAWDIWHGDDFYEVNPAGDIVWHYQDIYHPHDAQWLANGNLLYTAAEPIPAEIAARICGGDQRRDAPDGVIQGDVVREVNRAGDHLGVARLATPAAGGLSGPHYL